MTTRILPPQEWPRLASTLLASVWQSMNPAFCEVIVVEDGGEIVGSVALMNVLHAECISSDGRVSVTRALWDALGARVRQTGGTAVWAAAIDAPMDRILARHAEPIPGQHFLLAVE